MDDHLTPDEWRELEAVFDEIIESDRAARERILAERFEHDARLLREALGWSRSLDDSSDFLNRASTPESYSFSVQAGQKIGDWEIIEAMGRGGTSEVYRVQRSHADFTQTGALKLLRSANFSDHFRRERQLLTRLDHPGIAHFLDGGITDNQLAYTVMEFVRGASLEQYCESEHPPLNQRLRLFLQLCDAVSHAHSQLILHKDLKPANIRMTADGLPKLLDFGIGQLRDDPHQAHSGVATFTPSYAAPEQIEQQPATTATDVYGLGAILHFLLTQNAPWGLNKASLIVAIERVLDETPPNLFDERFDTARQVPRRLLTHDLNLIVQKAMARQADQRYTTVQELAADVRAVLDKRPISLRNKEFRYRCWQLMRRKPWQVATGALAGFTLIGGLALSHMQSLTIAAERDAALRSAERAHAVRTSLFQLLHASQKHGEGFAKSDLFLNSIDEIRRLHADEPDTAASLLAGFGQIYFLNNHYQLAEPLLQEALSLVDNGATAGTKLPEARLDLAQTLFRRGKTQEARERLDQATAIMDQEPDRYRADSIDSASLRAQLLRAEGEIETAIQVLQQALDDQIRFNGENSTVTAVLATNLATNYLYAGQQQEALQGFERAWSYWELTGQTDSPDALNQLNNWGLAALRAGAMEVARVRLEQAHATRSQSLGPSGALAALKKNLAEVYWVLGDWDAAETMMSAATDMAAQYVGESSPLHQGIGAYLADLQLERGKLQQAETTLDQCCIQPAGVSPLMDARTRAIRLTLTAQMTGKAPSSEAFQAVIDTLAGQTGPAQNVLAFVEEKWAQALSDPEQALAHWQNALAIRQQAQGRDHWQTLRTQLLQSRAMRAHRPALQADELREDALRLTEQRYGADSALARAFYRHY